MAPRRRFERSDVIEESPLVHILGLIVVVIIAFAVVFVANAIWNRVKTEDRLDDQNLALSLSSQEATVVPEGSYSASGSPLQTVLFLTVDSKDIEDETVFVAAKSALSSLIKKFTGSSVLDADEEPQTDNASSNVLSAVRIATINTETYTGSYADIPTDTQIVADDTVYTLGGFVQVYGYEMLVARLSQVSGVHVDHVIVSSEDVLEQIAGLSKVDASELVAKESSLLKKLRTDMDDQEFIDFAKALATTGVSSLVAIEGASYAETTYNEVGEEVPTGYYLINKTHVVVSLGLMVPAPEG